ncbi:bile acid:sodium symporter family protein [Sphingosinicella soli]|uniref:Sodium/bile acid cotransporter 7 n=1 Tax=Sphingosinicella soli TaxID=333708 RepID=A0A7W7F5H9_9SPHN|nr:bile acid:sodium symporter family protein [Sphingosinicella soli]MBB4631430.1 sodium/bile acid cotransporter 7 [Sphingosinicella soli]
MLGKLRPDTFTIALVATVLVATVLPCRGDAAIAFAWAAKAAIMLLFFLHGAKLSREAIVRGAGAVKLHVAGLSLTYLAFPGIGLLIALLPESLVSADIKAGIMFLAVLPSTVQSAIAFTSISHGNVAGAICSASLSNLLGVFLTPVLAGLLIHAQGTTGAIDTLAAIRSVVVTVLIPFVVGHMSRPLTAGLIARHGAIIGKVDRGAILLVVYTAFSAAVVDGLWSRVSGFDLAVVAGLSVVMLGAILALSLWMAHITGMSRADKVALLFCGSTKSLASGVPIAAALFAAPVVGMLMLPLLIYHQIQLIACAVIARVYADHEGYKG